MWFRSKPLSTAHTFFIFLLGKTFLWPKIPVIEEEIKPNLALLWPAVNSKSIILAALYLLAELSPFLTFPIPYPTPPPKLNLNHEERVLGRWKGEREGKMGGNGIHSVSLRDWRRGVSIKMARRPPHWTDRGRRNRRAQDTSLFPGPSQHAMVKRDHKKPEPLGPVFPQLRKATFIWRIQSPHDLWTAGMSSGPREHS